MTPAQKIADGAQLIAEDITELLQTRLPSTPVAAPPRPAAPVTTWMNRQQAAEYAGTSIDALGDALRSKELRGYQTGKRGRWRIRREDLDAWIRGENADVRVPAVTRQPN